MQYLKKYYKYRLKQLGGSQFQTPQDKLLFLIGSCAQNGFVSEVKPFINLNKTFRGDDQLWSVIDRSPGMNGKTYFMAAAFSGDVPKLRKLLPYFNINSTDDFGKSVLMLACERAKNDAVIFLLNNGANINLVYQYDKTAFMFACETCNVEVITRFIQLGANIQSVDQFGKNALMFACEKGNIVIVDYFIRQGVDVNIQIPYTEYDEDFYPDSNSHEGKTALVFACENNYTQVVNLLLLNHAQINSPEMKLAFLNAISNNRMELVMLLIQNNIDINNYGRQTPLKVAIVHNNIGLINELIARGVNVREDDFYAAIDYSISSEIIISIINHGLTINSGVFSRAIEKGNTDIINALIDRGADLNGVLSNFLNITPLMYACKIGRLESVKLLVERGARLEDTFMNSSAVPTGKSIMMFVFNKIQQQTSRNLNTDTEIIKILSNYNFNNDIEDIGMTAVMFAVQNSSLNIVEYLCSRGARINLIMRIFIQY